MKIDILRSTNPALSLSSQTEDPIDFRHYFGSPPPLELTPRLRGALVTHPDRSKSAPPPPGDNDRRDAEDLSRRKEPPQTRLSSSYNNDDRCSPFHHNFSNFNSDSSNGQYYPWYKNSSSDGSSASSSVDEGNPEDIMCDPALKRTFPDGADGGVTHLQQLHVHAPVASRPSSYNNNSSSVAKDENPIEQQQHKRNSITKSSESTTVLKEDYFYARPSSSSNNKRSSSSPTLTAAEGTPFSQNSGGVLVLRPNPVKTVPPIVAGVVGGVVAPVPRLSNHSSAHYYLLQQRQEEDDIGPTEPVRYLQGTTKLECQKHGNSNSSRVSEKSWCGKAAEKARKEKEERRLAELRWREEVQCNFPNSYSKMPPASGRSSAQSAHDEDSNSVRPEEQPQLQYSRSSAARSTSSSIPPSFRNDRERRRMQRASEDVGGAGPQGSIQSTPVFERLVTDEVREIQAYTRMVEDQSLELDKLRTYQKDLEKRLQEESRLLEQLEATLEARERDWISRSDMFDSEIKRLNNVVKAEENKNKLLLDQIRKKDQDIQGMLKKKYDSEVPGSRTARSIRGTQDGQRTVHHSASKSLLEARAAGGDSNRSPDDYLKSLGTAENVRQRNTRDLLMDFFGL